MPSASFVAATAASVESPPPSSGTITSAGARNLIIEFPHPLLTTLGQHLQSPDYSIKNPSTHVFVRRSQASLECGQDIWASVRSSRSRGQLRHVRRTLPAGGVSAASR